MSSSDTGYKKLAEFLTGLAVGGLLGWFLAAVLWPWGGPALLKPCPMPTTIGVVIYSAYTALSCGVRMLKD